MERGRKKVRRTKSKGSREDSNQVSTLCSNENFMLEYQGNWGGCKIGAVRKMIGQNKVGFIGLVETKKARSSV